MNEFIGHGVDPKDAIAELEGSIFNSGVLGSHLSSTLGLDARVTMGEAATEVVSEEKRKIAKASKCHQ